jgi:putative flavoprotein involved in K+ transport
MTTEHVETVIVGGGQAGLATGYHLAKRGRSFLILDANERVGDAWRKRWDSLRLFTPAWASHLPGTRFPARRNYFPTKDEMADYLESYAERFELPVRTSSPVTGLSRNGDTYVVTAGRRQFEADNVVVATGAESIPRVPDFAPDLDPGIVQLHSKQYLGPEQLQEGSVLVVGVGNSGAEIAYELAKTHESFLSGTPSAQLPFKHGPAMATLVFPIIRFAGLHVLTMRTPIGRKIRPKFVKLAAPLIRVKLKDLARSGVEQVDRTVGVDDGRPVLADGRVLDVANVIWCTGFRYDFSWIDLPVFGYDGAPTHTRGVADDAPGLYFMGLRFQFAAASDVFPGVGRDAQYVAKHIASRERTSRSTSSLLTA